MDRRSQAPQKRYIGAFYIFDWTPSCHAWCKGGAGGRAEAGPELRFCCGNPTSCHQSEGPKPPPATHPPNPKQGPDKVRTAISQALLGPCLGLGGVWLGVVLGSMKQYVEFSKNQGSEQYRPSMLGVTLGLTRRTLPERTAIHRNLRMPTDHEAPYRRHIVGPCLCIGSTSFGFNLKHAERSREGSSNLV